MKRIEEWEWSRGNQWRGRVYGGSRDARWEKDREDELKCEECGKICKNKGGLTIHRKRMHEVSSKKKQFKYGECGGTFSQEANLLNHLKICDGAVQNDQRTCEVCLKKFSRKYIKRHLKNCAARRGIMLPPPALPPPAPDNEESARIYRPKRTDCPTCGRNVAATNLQRHLKTAWCRAQRA